MAAARKAVWAWSQRARVRRPASVVAGWRRQALGLRVGGGDGAQDGGDGGERGLDRGVAREVEDAALGGAKADAHHAEVESPGRGDAACESTGVGRARAGVGRQAGVEEKDDGARNASG